MPISLKLNNRMVKLDVSLYLDGHTVTPWLAALQ